MVHSYKDLDGDLTAKICLVNLDGSLFMFNGCRFQFWLEHLLVLIEKRLTTRSTPSLYLYMAISFS
jgi:hypothetical protein